MNIQTKKKLNLEIEELKKELAKNKVIFSYNSAKIEDDFNVLNQVLELKVSNYENVVFVFNRYKEEKKVNVTTDEIEKATTEIIYESFEVLSEVYINYLVTKYFASKEAMIEVYTQRIYLRLFAFANNYNTTKTQTAFSKKS